MRTLPIVALLLAAAPTAHARSYNAPPSNSGFEWLDILTAEMVGEIGSRTYDAHGNNSYLGTSDLQGGRAIMGGFGLRSVIRAAHGVRFSIEGAGEWGRMTDTRTGFASLSRVTRGEFLTGIGYEIPLGSWFVLHTATLLGVDYQTMDAQPTRAVLTQLPADAVSASASNPSVMLDQVSLRLGQQVGFHIQLARMVALYADGTIDYDGQWRVRAGIAIGQVLRR